jgi:hypothetical protein
MERPVRDRITRLAIMVALFAAPAAAHAQSTTGYSDTWIDVNPDDDRGGPTSLAEARSSGGGMVITGARHDAIPPTHTVTSGDTLWDISEHYYGNPYEWPRVWSYNPEITNPHWIYPQDQLRLVPEGATIAPTTTGPHRHVATSAAHQPDDTLWLREQGWLDREALERAGEVIGSPTDHMLMSPYDEVYLRFDHVDGVPEGEFTIFRELEASAREPGEQGTLVRILGTVRIDSWDPDRHTARATLIEALEPIERGFRVAAIPRRFEVVAPVAADRDANSTVVASLIPHVLLGSDQIVFVPIGSDDGLVLGNRLYVVRAGDEWRRTLGAIGTNPSSLGSAPESSSSDPSGLPDEVIAEGRVVSVRPHSAGLFITRATRTVEVGDRVQLRQGY